MSVGDWRDDGEERMIRNIAVVRRIELVYFPLLLSKEDVTAVGTNKLCVKSGKTLATHPHKTTHRGQDPSFSKRELERAGGTNLQVVSLRTGLY